MVCSNTHDDIHCLLDFVNMVRIVGNRAVTTLWVCRNPELQIQASNLCTFRILSNLKVNPGSESIESCMNRDDF